MNEPQTGLSQEQNKPCKHLCQSQVEMIDEAVGSVGEYGEVRLVIEKGRLRYICVQQSHDALKWVPGQLQK